MYKCEYCGKEFKNATGLYCHIVKIHKIQMTIDERYKFIHYIAEGKDIPKCKYCDNDIFISSRNKSSVCNNPECKRKYLSDIQKEVHKNNPQLAINARKRRLEYLSNSKNFETTAYGLRANKKLSYLENWFLTNIIEKYKLYDKYLIINEYKIKNEDYTSAYSLDFAFMNIKLDVELDGKIHFKNENRIQHDIIRDKYLISNGWNIFRISYDDVKYNSTNIINNFLSLLNNNSFVYDKSYYIRNKIITNDDLKTENKNYKIQLKNKRFENIKNILIDLEQNSNINFSKHGWVKQATEYLCNKGFICKQLHRTLLKYYPEFFENNDVFIRKK